MLRVPSVVTLHLQSLKCLSLKCMYPVKQWFCVVNPFLKTAFSRAPVHLIFGILLDVMWTRYLNTYILLPILKLTCINYKLCQNSSERRWEILVRANLIRLELSGSVFLNPPLCNGCEKQENAFLKWSICYEQARVPCSTTSERKLYFRNNAILWRLVQQKYHSRSLRFHVHSGTHRLGAASEEKMWGHVRATLLLKSRITFFFFFF